MKKIGILNDIHGNYLLFDKVYNLLNAKGVEEFIVCGDMITDGVDNNKVLNKVKSITNNAIKGNREESIILYDGKSWDGLEQWASMLYGYNELTKENKEYINTLPNYKIVNIEGKNICISHGSPYNTRDSVKEYDYEIFDRLIDDFNCDVYLFAHIHTQFNVKYKERLFINSGAINCNNGKPVCTYGILTIDNGAIDYEPKEYIYNFNEVKQYYLQSQYHKCCREWSNLIIYTLFDAHDYCIEFIDYLNKYNKNTRITNCIWKKSFESFMREKGLKIY